MHYGFIGAGNMASAIIRGAVASGGFAKETIGAYDCDADKTQNLHAQCGMRVFDTLEALAAWSDILVLAVKPQVLDTLLPSLRPLCTGKTLFSIAAGKTLDYYAERLGPLPMVRLMPNINARVRASATSLCANAQASAADVEAAKALFAAVGTVIELPETLFPVFGAIAGASPAFSYMYIDALAKAGVRAGMPRDAALTAAAGAVLGSAKLVMESGEHPLALADQVCSPGGTTIEGVCTLHGCGFEGIVEEAVLAVIEKEKCL